MSDGPESPQPAAVPYQAYRSKRQSQSHSRSVSISRLTPSASPPPTAPATNVVGIIGYDSWGKEAFNLAANQSPPAVPVVLLQSSPPTSNGLPSPPESPSAVDVPEPMKTLCDDDSNEDATPIENDEPIGSQPPTTPSSPTASSSGSPSHANESLPRLNTGTPYSSTSTSLDAASTWRSILLLGARTL
ncbi:hypothetical protein BDZ89DRAFT_1126668 [Hymenopellis radicata]|nr:hypothetical protein BDZ89DRAFT_1126664 [Hymenopellis radicata]KAF9049271.1 hypothetical protein BDZ89DRAFT_1126668 [Hymenopellis radicata]